jgi:hypothetical protein
MSRYSRIFAHKRENLGTTFLRQILQSKQFYIRWQNIIPEGYKVLKKKWWKGLVGHQYDRGKRCKVFSSSLFFTLAHHHIAHDSCACEYNKFVQQGPMCYKNVSQVGLKVTPGKGVMPNMEEASNHEAITITGRNPRIVTAGMYIIEPVSSTGKGILMGGYKRSK